MRKAWIFWELPQLVLGFMLFLVYKKNIIKRSEFRQTRIYVIKGLMGGLSLSWLIFLKPGLDHYRVLAHEYGHSRQSLYLGWLFLPVIGLPSIIRSLIWKKYPMKQKRYYQAFPENWADRLGKYTGTAPD